MGLNNQLPLPRITHCTCTCLKHLCLSVRSGGSSQLTGCDIFWQTQHRKRLVTAARLHHQQYWHLEWVIREEVRDDRTVFMASQWLCSFRPIILLSDSLFSHCSGSSCSLLTSQWPDADLWRCFSFTCCQSTKVWNGDSIISCNYYMISRLPFQAVEVKSFL